jgi:hypothetical protein
MGKIELDHTGSGSGVTLSSDGTDLLLDGSAIGGGGGGADLYAANESTPSAQPSATGTNAIAIGEESVASGNNSFAVNTQNSIKGATGSNTIAMGDQALAEGSYSVAIGRLARAGASASNSVAIGNEAYATGQQSVSIGYDATCLNNSYALAIGYDAYTVAGNYATAIGNSYAQGGGAFAANIANNTSTYGATGASSVAIGSLAKSTNTQSLAISGNTTTASGIQATSIGGENNTASGTRATALGGSTNYATGQESYAFGNRASAKEIGKYSYGGYFGFSGTFAGGFGVGGSQGGMMILGAATTDATPTVLRTNTSAAGSTNQLVAFTDTCIMFSGTLVAMQNGAQDQGGWEIKGLLKNDGGTTTLVSSNIQTFADGNGWTVALTADNTNNALAITCTGEAAHNIRWVANISTSEVTYA